MANDKSTGPRCGPAPFSKTKGKIVMAEINVPQFLGERIRKAGAALHAACEKMPEDRISWKPVCEGNTGRDALDQALECAYLNEWVAAAYKSGNMPGIDWDDY